MTTAPRLIETPRADLDPPAVERTTDYALASRHAPRIRFDRREPFFPIVAGYTVFGQSAPSPSFPRRIALPPETARAIEYAVWWDWDIQHLYELEHIWVYLGPHDRVVGVEASWHGKYNPMVDAAGGVPLESGRVTLCSEPGKHAFAPSPRWLLDRSRATRRACGVKAGRMGLHVTPLYEEAFAPHRTAEINRLVHTYLRRRAFMPAFAFTEVFDLRQVPLVPWVRLASWIPQRVGGWLRALLDGSFPARAQRRRAAFRRETETFLQSVARRVGALPDALRDALRRHGVLDYVIFDALRPEVLADLKAQMPEALAALIFGAARHESPLPTFSPESVLVPWEDAVAAPDRVLSL